MRYDIWQFAAPIDLRKLEFRTITEMREWATSSSTAHHECESEVEAVAACRRAYPDCIGMLCPVRCAHGEKNGTTMTVALIEKIVGVDVAGNIPFVMMVHAYGRSDMEKRQILKRRQFDMMLWKPPVLMPDSATYSGELRISSSVLPVKVRASFGFVRDKLVVYADDGSQQFSIAFDDDMRKALTLHRATE